jgi:DNA-binding NtrC family response regulator
VRAISTEALNLLTNHRWPGNVRQLENAVFRAVVLAESDTIGVDEFPQISAQAAAGYVSPTVPDMPQSVVEVPHLLEVSPSTAPALTPGMLSMLDEEGDVRPLDDIEADAIRFAIAHYRGQMSEVARRLKIGRSTLYRKLEFLGLDDKSGADHDEPAPAR